MHIQLFISEDTQEGDRLLGVLRAAMPGVPLIQYHDTEAIGRVMPTAYNEKIVAVIMVAERETLASLARRNKMWDRLKTILVLPDSEPETVTLGHVLRPTYMTFTNSDFSDVAAVLKHIRKGACGAEIEGETVQKQIV
jgi:hypothetical protein